MRLAWLLLGIAACGRFGFDSAEPDADADAARDAASDAASGACGPILTPPATVHVTGMTFRYESFDNVRTPITGASVAASDSPGGAAIATTSSDSAGTYDLAIPTGGVARPITVRYMAGTDFTSIAVFDQLLDRDVAGPNTEALQIGDAPIWNAGQMGSIYSAATLTRDPERAFLSVAVRDCSDAPIAGAVVDIQPAPEAVVYQAENGRPVITLVETQPRFGMGFGMNAIGGPTTVTVTHPTHTFAPIVVDVLTGSNNTLVVARAGLAP